MISKEIKKRTKMLKTFLELNEEMLFLDPYELVFLFFYENNLSNYFRRKLAAYVFNKNEMAKMNLKPIADQAKGNEELFSTLNASTIKRLFFEIKRSNLALFKNREGRLETRGLTFLMPDNALLFAESGRVLSSLEVVSTGLTSILVKPDGSKVNPKDLLFISAAYNFNTSFISYKKNSTPKIPENLFGGDMDVQSIFNLLSEMDYNNAMVKRIEIAMLAFLEYIRHNGILNEYVIDGEASSRVIEEALTLLCGDKKKYPLNVGSEEPTPSSWEGFGI